MRTLIHAIAAAALAGLALGQPVMTKLTYGRPGQDASAFGTDLTFPGFCRNGVAIGDDGRVIFSTQLAGPGTTVSNDWALGWTDGSTASKIARTGETLPGVPGGLNLGRASINNAGFAEVHMSDLGEVSFTSVLLVNGAWRTTLFAGPSTQPAFVMGAQFPTPGVAGNPTLAAIGTPLHMNSGGLVALDARPFQRGEYLMTADEGSQIAWVYEGDPAPLFTPPTSWSYKEGVQINDNNEIGFQGLLTASSVIRQQREVLYAGPPNQLRIVARSGFPAPDLPNTTYGRFINSNNFQAFSRGHWRIADDNVIAFSTPTTGLVDGAIFLGLFGDVRLYRADGQQAPDLPAGVLLDGLGESHVELNGNAEIAFSARLTGPGVDASNDSAIFEGPPNDPRLLVREGESLPGGGTLGDVYSGLGLLAYNDRRQIVFSSTASTGQGVLLATTPMGQLAEYARSAAVFVSDDGFIGATGALVWTGANATLGGSTENGRASVLNNRGEFVTTLCFGGSTGSAMFVMTAEDACRADLAAPFGVVSQSDVDAFVQGFFANDATVAAFALPFDVVSQADVTEFVRQFFLPCP